MCQLINSYDTRGTSVDGLKRWFYGIYNHHLCFLKHVLNQMVHLFQKHLTSIPSTAPVQSFTSSCKSFTEAAPQSQALQAFRGGEVVRNPWWMKLGWNMRSSLLACTPSLLLIVSTCFNHEDLFLHLSSQPSVSRLQEFSRESHLKTASFHVPFLWWLKFVRDIGMFPENTCTFSWRSFSRNQNNAPNHPLVGS